MFANVSRLICVSVLIFGTFVSARAAELIMVEEPGCVWCARWNTEIGPIYPKTAEARRAPLRRMDISDVSASGITFKSRVTFTPTFILVEDGQEVIRIEGYPGEDFFWGLLAEMLKQLPEGSDT